MKSLLKVAAFAALVVTFAACDESPVKSDYDPVADPTQAPQVVLTYDADVYQTKVRLSGKVSDYANLVDYGFICCIDTVLDQVGGDFREALINGALSKQHIVSMKGVADADEFIFVSDEYDANAEYYYTTYAQNYNGITCGDPVLFETGALYKGVYNLSASSSEADWEEVSYVMALGEDPVRPFEFVQDGMTKAGSFVSYAKAGPNKYTPDNWLVFKSDLGVAMQFSYLVKPLATKATSFHERYQILISKDSITADNYAAAEILVDYTFVPDTVINEDGSESLVVPEVGVEVIDIPQEYEYSKAWIAIRHFDTYTQGLSVNAVKLY